MNEEMSIRARKLRKKATGAENHLWKYLRARRLSGYKFKRQEIIGQFIVDFICHHRKLIIELDGGQHLETSDYDEKRTEYLNKSGYRVVRYWNNEVLRQTDAVLADILTALQR